MDWTFAIRWILATVGVIGLMLVVFYLSGRNMKRKGSDLEILEGLPLGNRQGIYLVRVRDRLFVIGITPTSMQLLCELEEDGKKKDSARAEIKEGN